MSNPVSLCELDYHDAVEWFAIIYIFHRTNLIITRTLQDKGYRVVRVR